MLKIKDNVDLKELEKFGFTVIKDFLEGTSCVKSFLEEESGMSIDTTLYINTDRIIQLDCYADCSDEYTFNMSSDCSEILEIMFNLIQAGLVEKV